MYGSVDLFTANRGSKNGFIVRMAINAIWIVIGLVYAGFGMSLTDRRNMYRYVMNGGAFHNPMSEVFIGLFVVAIAAYCLYRNFKKSQVTLTLMNTGIRGKDTSGYSFNLPLHMISNVRIVKNVLVVDTQTRQLFFKGINNMAQMGNMILDALNESGRPAVPGMSSVYPYQNRVGA